MVEIVTKRLFLDQEASNPGFQKLQELLNLWESLKGDRRYPSRGDFDPHTLKPWLGNIELIDVIGSDPPRYKFRLVGTRITAIDGLDATGRFADEVFSKNYAGIVGDYDEVFATGSYVARELDWIENHRGLKLRYNKLTLPLSSNGDTIDMLLVYLEEAY